MWMMNLITIAVFVGFLVLAWKKPALALVLLLPIAAGMFFSGLVYFDGEIPNEGFLIVLLPILLVLISIGLIHWNPPSDPLETPWYKTVTAVIIMIFKYLFIFTLFSLLFNFIGTIQFAVFLAASFQFAQAQKYGLTVDIISTLETCMRQSLPLPTALTAAAFGQKKKQARIFNAIAYWLTQGQPLSEAIQRGYRKCPPDVLASITAAEKMDQLPAAIASIQADLSEKMNDFKTPKPVNPWYPLMVISVAFTIIAGLAIFVVPTYAEVLKDMSDGQAVLPAATQSLLTISDWMVGRRGLNASLVFLPVFCLVNSAVYVRFRRRTPRKPRFLSRLGDRLKWYTPVLHGFENTLGNLRLVQTLRSGLKAGYPVNTILRNALGLDVNICYRRRIENWLTRIEAGESIAQSAGVCKLDKSLVWAFDEKVNKGNTPQILDGMEDIYRNSYNYRKNVLAAVSWPLAVLGLGLVVGYVVYAMFMGSFSILFVTLQYTIPS